MAHIIFFMFLEILYYDIIQCIEGFTLIETKSVLLEAILPNLLY